MDFLNIVIQIFAFFGITPENTPKYILFGVIFFIGFQWILNKKIEPLDATIKKMESFVVRLCGALESGGEISKIQLYQSGSPLNLTDKGKNELTNIGFIEGINTNLDYLLSLIDKFKPASAFDVEKISIAVINYAINDSEVKIFKTVEDYIYSHPEYNNPEYFKAAGIYLRDKYFERHPNLLPPN